MNRAAAEFQQRTGLLLVVVAGLLGTPNPERNINMTLFWIVFLLGFAYLTVLVGDLFSLINPWKVIAAVAPQGSWTVV